jgi:hypothetical protein
LKQASQDEKVRIKDIISQFRPDDDKIDRKMYENIVDQVPYGLDGDQDNTDEENRMPTQQLDMSKFFVNWNVDGSDLDD